MAIDKKILEKFQSIAVATDQIQEIYKDNSIRYFTPHPSQGRFIESCFNNKESWAFCGNRSGKTYAGAIATVSMALGIYPLIDTEGRKLNINWVHRKNSVHWVCSVSTKTQRTVIQPRILKFLPKRYIEKITYVMRGVIDDIQLTNGSTISFMNYTQDVDKFTGADVDSIWFDEEPRQDIYEESLIRTIDRGGHIFGTLTPVEGQDWIYRDVYEKRHENKIHVFNWSIDDNPFISQELKSEVLGRFRGQDLEIRQKGLFVELYGLIYPQYNEDIHFIDDFDIPSHWPKATATDPHLAKPITTVWMARAPEDYKGFLKGDYFVYRELSKEGIPSDVVMALKVATGNERLKGRLGDPSLNIRSENFPGLNTFDEYAQLGWPMLPANKSVMAGIDKIRDYLGSRPPKLYVFKSCPGTNYEFKHYKLKDISDDFSKNYSDRILKRNDDFLDPIRYIVNSPLLEIRRRLDVTNAYEYTESGRIKRIRAYG